jgi:glucose/arabinose dehydrogenase
MNPWRTRCLKRIGLGAALFLCLSAFPATTNAYDLAAWLTARIIPEKVERLDSGDIFRVETLTEGLESPWAVVPAPDGRIFITERPGRLRIFENGKLQPEPVAGVPRVHYQGQGGLLDMVLHPDFAENRRLYLAYTVNTEGGAMTRISRFRETPEGLTEPEVIFPGVLGSQRAKHFGCRMVFGTDGRLYFTLGERGEGRRSQDLMDLNGKTLRLTEDGAVPPDNPFVGRSDARPEIFTYGNRNSQGMAVQPETGYIFQTEHGPSWNDAPGGGDEVNVMVPGGNYGWPVVHHRETREGMISPLLEYTPAIAPAGAAFYTGDRIPRWKHNFFFTNLVGRMLVRVVLDGAEVKGQEFLLEDDYGRLRDVATGPEGGLLVLTSDTDAYGPGRAGGDRLLRIVPK